MIKIETQFRRKRKKTKVTNSPGIKYEISQIYIFVRLKKKKNHDE